LSPITIGGLPTPGPVLAGVTVPPLVEVFVGAGVEAALLVDVLDELDELDDELPHAASATAASAPAATVSSCL
jgi:hypothetical protein